MEFAIIFPVLVMLVLGLLTGGITLNRKIAITNGVREGSRYGATLPVASAPTCTNSTPYLNCWLAAVASVAQQGAENELDAGVASRRICVAYVYPNGTTAADQNRMLVRTAAGDSITSGASATCFADGRSGAERRVQVLASREGSIEYLVGTSRPTLTSRSVTRYEAAV